MFSCSCFLSTLEIYHYFLILTQLNQDFTIRKHTNCVLQRWVKLNMMESFRFRMFKLRKTKRRKSFYLYFKDSLFTLLLSILLLIVSRLLIFLSSSHKTLVFAFLNVNNVEKLFFYNVYSFLYIKYTLRKHWLYFRSIFT